MYKKWIFLVEQLLQIHDKSFAGSPSLMIDDKDVKHITCLIFFFSYEKRRAREIDKERGNKRQKRERNER